MVDGAIYFIYLSLTKCFDVLRGKQRHQILGFKCRVEEILEICDKVSECTFEIVVYTTSRKCGRKKQTKKTSLMYKYTFRSTLAGGKL